MSMTRHELQRDTRIVRSLERIVGALEDQDTLDALVKIAGSLDEMVETVERIEAEVVELRKALPSIA